MKLVSTFMNDLYIEKGKFHTITFESTVILQQFRQLIHDYFYNRNLSECQYLSILNDRGKSMKGKDFHFISFDCNVINLQEEKGTKKLMQELLLFHLENNPTLLKEYLKFNSHIDQFLSQIEMKHGNLIIDVQATEKTIMNFIKSLDIIMDYEENEDVPNYRVREFLIKSLLEMNITEKEPVLFISYPETDVGHREISQVIQFLKGLSVTTIVLTVNNDLLTAADENRMFLINKNGDLYDILNLKLEMQAFELVEEKNLSTISKKLAFLDFKEDYSLLDNKMKEFLLSNRI